MSTSHMHHDLFEPSDGRVRLGEAAWVLRGRALADSTRLLDAIAAVAAQAPFRQMITPGGRRMSVAMTSCGHHGWTTDRRGYRYSAVDPDSSLPWPTMPAVLRELAVQAASEAGFAGFAPDACLINRYAPGARMGLHQDRDERDLTAPIVSLSLGMTATFLFGGLMRGERPQRIALHHGDVLVWGGPDRLRHHGIAPLRGEPHPQLGPMRINCTLRKAD